MIIGLIIILAMSLLIFVFGIRGLVTGIKEKDIDIIIFSFMPIIIGLGFFIGFLNQLIII
ncbi:hypothetical protein [Clostridium sporogenes]|uniref:hypothetical protein n=1 Tax=Clostridium sporogenes TaxID=1509 RepID=UPI0013D7E09A|nr:hypothetical protein [Clostridium sporogenes]NFF75966.1 hypothetical protein [Clostridium sporogenes]NFH40863.1 hypothetical protein [Clostridium sporogenes]